MQKRNVLVVDVETCGTKVKKVYDLGVAVVEYSTGKILASASWIIKDIFFSQTREMNSAHYSNKLPQYFAGMGSAWEVVTFNQAREQVAEWMSNYNISQVYAYNCSFDSSALLSTARFLEGESATFFPPHVEYCDIWHMACQTTMKQKGYAKFAHAAGFISPKGNIQSGAEACYAYITKNPSFEEQHTGLADVLIEIEIMRHAIRQKKKMDKGIKAHCWRLVQPSG